MKKICRSIKNTFKKVVVGVTTLVHDVKGDLATNTIGGIIVAVVIIGLLVVAINTFFPTFFTDMFNAMKTKLSANW